MFGLIERQKIKLQFNEKEKKKQKIFSASKYLAYLVYK